MLALASSSWMVRGTAVQPLVLVVAEDPQTQHTLVSMLAGNGIRAFRVGFALPALTRALGHGPGLVLFDWSRPEFDGVGLTARLRGGTQAPILVVLPQAQDEARAAVIGAGASDYVLASLGVGEQLARIRFWFAHMASPGAVNVTSERGRGRLRLDRQRRILFVDGSEMHMTPLECRLVTALAENTATALSEERIVAAVWDAGQAPQPQYLRTLIRHLRQKIERDPLRPVYLVGTPGAGYRLRLG